MTPVKNKTKTAKKKKNPTKHSLQIYTGGTYATVFMRLRPWLTMALQYLSLVLAIWHAVFLMNVWHLDKVDLHQTLPGQVDSLTEWGGAHYISEPEIKQRSDVTRKEIKQASSSHVSYRNVTSSEEREQKILLGGRSGSHLIWDGNRDRRRLDQGVERWKQKNFV